MTISQRLFTLHCVLGLGLILSVTTMTTSSAAGSDKNQDIMAAGNLLYHGIYDDKAIKLNVGKWTGIPFVEGGASRPSAGLIENFTFTGDIDGNDTDESIVFLWESSGGSGNRVYMAVLGTRDDKLVNLATIFLGDRVQLHMGRVNQHQIELDLIEYRQGDAACCPTHKVFRSWSFLNNQLLENQPQFLGRISVADLEGVKWSLIQLQWHESLPENIQITLRFKDNKISGRSACNRYFASIKAGTQPNDITVSQAGSTRMACIDDVMKWESRYLDALSTVSKFSFINGQLALTWKDGDHIKTMLFSAQNEAQE